MGSTDRTKVFSSFFLDGAKIIFGSLVVGAFMPSAVGQDSTYITVVLGVILTIIFLTIADALVKREKHTASL